MLRPQENATRELKSLAGLWRFRADADGVGRAERWYAGPLRRPIDMPVPASYNEITADPALYNHVGDVWYQTTTYVPEAGRTAGSSCASTRPPTGPRSGSTTPR
ncbi:hypothetical protein [Raineyella fluvialis]|uniref:hypothetical protein n=1 Tax=Raineyella fluvialis TaxID=2662261 RepID=UPI001E3A112B|nr:hypothetical protein [Raineyella fluvialis]